MDFEILPVGSQDLLGEGPCWESALGRLTWVDIKGRRIRRAGLDGVEEDPISTPEDVGFAVPAEDGTLVVGLRSGVFSYSPADGWRSLWAADYDTHSHRINDGKTDSRGRLWFGTMHDPETESSSAFYRYDDKGVVRQFGDVTTSNGLGWSPDERTLYYTDSMTRCIFAFDVDADEGRLSNRRVFARDPDGYIPDGLTVDLDGGVWSAKWDGGRVVRYDPSGRLDLALELPVRRPTSVAFVGSDLRTLVVTSASLDRGPDEALGGSVFLVPTRVQGREESVLRVPQPPRPA